MAPPGRVTFPSRREVAMNKANASVEPRKNSGILATVLSSAVGQMTDAVSTSVRRRHQRCALEKSKDGEVIGK